MEGEPPPTEYDFHPLLEKSWRPSSPCTKRATKLDIAWPSLVISYFFLKLKALAPLACLKAAIIGLFLGTDVTNKMDLIKELDLEVFLIDSFMRPLASISLEKKEKDKL